MFATTAKERRRNSAIIDRRRTILERWVEPKLRRAMRKLGAEAELEYGRGGLGRVGAIAVADYQAEVAEILEDLYGRSAISMAKLIKDSAKAVLDIRETKDVDVTLERLMEYFRALALTQAKTIAETMKVNITGIMAPLVEEGAGEAEIGRAIRKQVDDLAPWQARRIARTETLMASSQAQDEIVDEMDDLPPMAKEWDSSRDSRTRRSHRGVRPVLKDEKFKVGSDLMRYPGDRSANIREIANCRCNVSYAPADQMAELEAEVDERLADIQEDEDFDDDSFVEPN